MALCSHETSKNTVIIVRVKQSRAKVGQADEPRKQHPLRIKAGREIKKQKKKACFFPGMIVNSGQIMQNLIFSTEMQRRERHPEFRRKKQLLVIKRPNMEESSLIWQRSPLLDLSSGTENTG